MLVEKLPESADAMTPLKLAAMDAADLDIVSAHVQDAVLKIGDLQFHAGARRFVLAMNRLAWETVSGRLAKRAERRRSVLHFDRVLAVKLAGIDRSKPAEVLSLLAVRFKAGEPPAGIVELVFAGSATIRLEVECIEARLADLGAAWQASSLPAHRA
jgi:hypothetical protein